MAKQILALPGDGAGPFLISAAEAVISAVSDVELVYANIGYYAKEKEDTYLPYKTLEAAKKAKAILAGQSVMGRKDLSYRDPFLSIRKQLLLQCVVKEYTSLNRDRESDKGKELLSLTTIADDPATLVSTVEKENIDGAVCERFVSSYNTGRIFSAAENYLSIKKAPICCVYDPDVYPLSDRSLLKRFYDDMYNLTISDKTCDELISDIIDRDIDRMIYVMPNIHDSYITSVASKVICRKKSLVPIGYIGRTHGMFGPLVPQSTDKPDPTSEILAAAMALDWIGEKQSAQLIRAGVHATYQRSVRDKDIVAEVLTKIKKLTV